ncbi:2-oxoglutarate dehydrogenase E1 component [Paenibacillus koleovorans]|uniref:2-oxoglutarate dehydrogenase E1 component n=1 Tax=Paenibacillus koleovorans TaxID=121608 RepID=UPI000FDA2DA0|nr:2-oxoglutarate dehydrogenase E1 component [Paenibacillus koleovorans]
MPTEQSSISSPWQHYYGPNLGYVLDMYDRYLEQPETVDAAFRELFEQWGPPSVPTAFSLPERKGGAPETTILSTGPQANDPVYLKKIVDAGKLVRNIRTYGHLAARTDTLGISVSTDSRYMEPEMYRLSEADLKAIPASLIWEEAPETVRNGWEVIGRLRDIYTQSIGFEFAHIHAEDERLWLLRQVESGMAAKPLQTKERTVLLNRLIEVEQFETFLQRAFVGQKRFSIEGTDMLVPMLDEIVRELAHDGANNILMGMAHRGRLNVLAHVLGKPYSHIFSEFHHAPNKDLFPSEGSLGINFGWTGDVKYHLGAHRSVKSGETVETRLTLANNPSHLEYVNPVVQGFARAAQDDRTKAGYPKADFGSAAAVLMHGDAAFAGEGIVAETLNFKKLIGYESGGTIHIIVNNRIGFTTDSDDSRSTHYASDLAKGYEIPIVHVNADDPEACIAAVRIACEYRTRFRKDFLIDLIGYRRFGHNETDDPGTTQPLQYMTINKHPRVATLYADSLQGKGLVTADRLQTMRNDNLAVLQSALDTVKEDEKKEHQPHTEEKAGARRSPMEEHVTSVPLDRLQTINANLLKWPEPFTIYNKLERILKRRAEALQPGGKVDWGLAETLAFATILADGKPIRLSGQDTERATFAHRNLVLHDAVTGEGFCPLHTLPEARASFAIYNSPLAEASVLGFDYGYNVYAPETLVIWEAQYGDFANAAQVIIDQFISAGRGKWQQHSGVVMLLPHGYEGQGPEHSSARLERFLTLAAEDNMTIANLTSAAQYFHLLRRQAAIPPGEELRPLIVMSPKSLIRNAYVASDPVELSEGVFQMVLEQPGLGDEPELVERLVLCTGKVAIDLATALDESADKPDWSWLHIARIEQLYPFPKSDIERLISRFPNLKEVYWVQEEPQNMGAWNYVEPRILSRVGEHVEVRYVGRPKRSSPASGFQHVHNAEQKRIVTTALSRSDGMTIEKEKGDHDHE